MSDAAQFYANRVLKEFKDKDPTHVEWVKQWMKVLSDLHAYVKQYHTTGLTWGAHGQQDSGAVGAPARAGGGVAPPPPPPPPPPAASLSSATQIDDGQSRTELMNSINALGTGVTSHLKKVPDELKLHKNPQLREQLGDQPIERSNVSNKSQVCFIFHSEHCNKNLSLGFLFFVLGNYFKYFIKINFWST
jgi:adenylyl cyclase-associated protein